MRFPKRSCRACGGASTQSSYGSQKKHFILTSGVTTTTNLNTMYLKKNVVTTIPQSNQQLQSNLYNFSGRPNKRIHMVMR